MKDKPAAKKPEADKTTPKHPKIVGGSAEKFKKLRYIPYIPKENKAGQYLCHNFIPHTADQQPGMNGFRVWIEVAAKGTKAGEKYDGTVCKCG